MRPASLLLGVLLGLFAIGFAWCRALAPARPAREAPQAATAAATSPAAGPAASEAAGAPAPSIAPASASDVEALRTRGLRIPVEGVRVANLHDDFDQARSAGRHEAIDLLAPRFTRVVAADDGFVAKLFTSARGGLTVYQFDRSQTYCYYYAHLAGYAPGLREGAVLRRGDLVGFVGTTGNAPPLTPHLHFAIFKLGAEKRWWQGVAINPYLVWASPADTRPAAPAAGGRRATPAG